MAKISDIMSDKINPHKHTWEMGLSSTRIGFMIKYQQMLGILSSLCGTYVLKLF